MMIINLMMMMVMLLQTAPWSVCFVIVGKLPGVVAPGISQQTANKLYMYYVYVLYYMYCIMQQTANKHPLNL